MNRIEQLLAELCPDGVEFRALGEVARIRNGRDYRALKPGSIPVYGSGGIMTHVDEFIYDLPSVLIPRKGSLGNIYYLDKPFWTVDTIFYTEIGGSLNAKYFFYYLQTLRLEKMNQAAGVPSQTQSNLNKIKIPIPSLAIQQEIVKILDKFVELQTELQTELQKRRIQYEYYRNALLTFPRTPEDNTAIFPWLRKLLDIYCPQGVAFKTLTEVLDMRAGSQISAKEIRQSTDKNYLYSCHGGNGLRGFVKKYNHDGEHLLIGRQGALCGNIHRVKDKFYATEHAVVVTAREEVNIDWMFHLLVVMNLNQYATKSAQPGLAVGRIQNLKIPIPPLEIQQKIVAILDKFDTLVNDLSIGLPAEIKLRRIQYEYYRNKLLTFKEKPALAA